MPVFDGVYLISDENAYESGYQRGRHDAVFGCVRNRRGGRVRLIPCENVFEIKASGERREARKNGEERQYIERHHHYRRRFVDMVEFFLLAPELSVENQKEQAVHINRRKKRGERRQSVEN